MRCPRLRAGLLLTLSFVACDDDAPNAPSGNDGASAASTGDAPHQGASSDGNEPTGGDASAWYAVYTQVRTPDGRTNYLALTDSVAQETELDPGTAMEVPGFSRFFAPETGGFFAIGDGESLEVTRFDVSEDGEFEQGASISFAQLGVTWLHYRAVFFSETRAYYIDNTGGQIVIWNPRDMEIVGTFPLPDPVVEGYEGYETILPFYKFPVVENRLFIPISWIDREVGTARDVTGLIVVDTETDTVLSYTETDRCPAATELAFDDNGDVYYGTDYYYPLYNAAVRGASRPSCVMRIRAGEVDFDPDYLLELEEVTGGRATVSLTDSAEPGVAYISVLDEETLPWEDFAAEPRFDEAWEWWRLDLETGEAARDPNIPVSGPGVSSHTIGDDRYIVRAIDDHARSQIYRLSADGDHEPGYIAPGFITGVARVH